MSQTTEWYKYKKLSFITIFFAVVLSFVASQSGERVFGASMPALKAHTVVGNPTGGTTSFTSSAINTSGATLLVAIVGSYANDPANNIIFDSNGNTWHHLTTQGHGTLSNQNTVIWYAYDHSGSPLVVGPGQTFTDANGGFDMMAVSAYSGTLTGSDPFDQQNSQTNSGSTFQSGSITPSANGELIVAGFATISTTMTDFSVDSGFSKLDFIVGTNKNLQGAVGYYVQPTAGAINPTFTSIGDSSPVPAVVIASFKAGTGGGADITPPVISSITSSSITSSSASISWTTDENSDSQIDYGTTNAYGASSALNSFLVTSHNISLSSLTVSTLYHFRVKSRDGSGNLAVSADNTFTTSSSGGGTTPSVTWTQYSLAPNGSTVPFQTGWERPYYDPSSGKIIMGGHTTGTTIYDDSLWTVNITGSTPSFSRAFYSGTLNCNSDTLTVPKDRHYYSQGWLDTNRNIFFQMGGACGSTFSDLYKISGPNFNSPQQLNPSNLPSSNAGEGAAIYDSNEDIAFLYLRTIGNFPKLYRYCSTIGNVGGALSSAQVAGGCTTNSTDSFEDITPASMPGSNNAIASMGFVWDSINHLGIMAFGYNSPGSALNETWVYTPQTNSWIQKANSNCPAVANPGMVFDPQSGLVLVHTGVNQDCAYNAANNNWSAMTSNTGPVQSCSSCDGMALDTVTHKLFYLQGSGGTQSFWVGQLNNFSGSDTQPPTLPTALSATAISSSQINLSWTASTDNVGVTGYKIYRGGIQIGTSIVASYSDTGLTPSTNYSYTVSAYDAAGNNSSQSTTANATTLSGSVSGVQMRSGAGLPNGSIGNDGDLYHRTDTNAIYGPRAVGSWPATFSYVLGVGCTTAYHIDKDCDGYGVGPTQLTVDPNPLIDVDADDNDVTVNTPASVITKWGTISAFLAHLGYPTNKIIYMDPVNGSDSTGAGTVGNPYKTWTPVITSLSYAGSGAGATLLYRGGVTAFGNYIVNSHIPYASSPSNPVVVMPYPGERGIVTGISADSQNFGKSANVIYDGWTLRCPNTGFGNGFDGNHNDGITIKNSEISGCSHGWQVGSGGQNLTIDGNVFHDTSSHAIYPTSAGLYAPGQFNCPAWIWDTTGGNFPSGFNPFTNLVVKNNLIYNSGTGGLEAIHLNAMICGGAVTGNFFHNTGGTGLGLQTSVQGTSAAPFLVANNVIFSNQSAAITISIYGCDNNGMLVSAGQTDCVNNGYIAGVNGPYYPNDHNYISIINNTLWTGQYASQGGGQCNPTSGPGQCTIPSYGILVNDYEVPFNGTLGGIPANHWIKNLTIKNNLIVTYNDCAGGSNQFKFMTNSFPDTNIIKNNMLWNLYTGNSQCAVMNISSDAQSSFAGNYSFSQFQNYNMANNSGNLFNNPLFSDVQLGYYTTPSLFNFHLQGASPALGAGTSGAPATDIAGLTRPNPPSIGAYEYGGVVSSLPTISSFQASPTSITSGGSSILSWSVSNSTSLSIDQGIGTVTGTSKSVSPTVTTTYTLTATNSSGSVSMTTTLTVNLNPDTIAPTVSITSPPNNQSVNGSITASASASDPTVSGQVNSGLFSLNLYVDNNLFAASTIGSLSKPLDTTTLTNASHSLVAVAKDNAGNQASSTPVSITVNNAVAQKYPRLITLSSLEGLSTIPSNQPITVTILSPSGGAVLETQTNLLPNASKQYTVTFLSSDPQLVNIRVKANGYLSQLLSNIDTTVNSPSVLTVPQLLSGDINNDNTVNSLDYSMLNSHWNQNFPQVDVNADGLINSLDYAVVKNNWNKVGK